MSDPKPDEDSVIIDAGNLKELGRTPDCGNPPTEDVDDATETVPDPHPPCRERDDHRELLDNPFPVEDDSA